MRSLGLGILVAWALYASPLAAEPVVLQPAQSSTLPAQDDVRDVAGRVLRWQLANMDNVDPAQRHRESTLEKRGWVQGALYRGIVEWGLLAKDRTATDAVKAWAEGNQWRLGERLFHGDDHVVGQSYARLVEAGEVDKDKLSFLRTNFKAIRLSAPRMSLEFTEERTSQNDTRLCQLRWCWSDALFMSPPAWVQLDRIDNDPVLSEYAHREFWAATEYLFDDTHGLYFRDSRIFEMKGEHGEPIFWSRGNGWVMAGLVHIIERMSADDPRRQVYTDLYRTFARAVIGAQRSDGYWHMSLLAPEAQSIPETSGTAFFVYGLKRGVDLGLIEPARACPAVARGWAALTRAVAADGRLGYVQQIGFGPSELKATDTQFYGVGALLLAASSLLNNPDRRFEGAAPAQQRCS